MIWEQHREISDHNASRLDEFFTLYPFLKSIHANQVKGHFAHFRQTWPTRDNRIIIKLSTANFCFEVSSLHNSLRGVLNTVYVEPRLIKCIQHHISVVVRINFFSFSDWVKYYMQKFDTNCTLEYNPVYDFKRRRDPNFSPFDRLPKMTIFF